MKNVIFINSHPIQYFAPLYKYLNENRIETEVWYCSDESIRGELDKGFGVEVKWDIPLLEGYKYRFFKNYSPKPSCSSGFFGLINLGLIVHLFKIPRSVIIVHGWHYFTHFFVILLGRLRGHVICLRNDMPQAHETFKKEWYQVIKRVGLKYLLFPFVNYFLYIGKQNKLFYESYDLPQKRLRYCPYAVDNDRFDSEYKQLKPNLASIKQSLGIPETDKIILFSGKYIDKKRPLDLLKAYSMLNDAACWLIMLGEGDLRKEMEALIKKHQLKQVILTGFINQSQISKYYAIADVFVMCSSLGENWGLSVNEAMNFNLPIILSDLTGCSEDLVVNGDNGYVFSTGNVEELFLKLNSVLVTKQLTNMTQSADIIKNYSFYAIAQSIRKLSAGS